MDIANTVINWMEYTQLAQRDSEDKKLRVIPEKENEVVSILGSVPPFIDRPEEHEYFQRKYGLDPKHQKDTRNLTASRTITAKLIAEQKIKKAFIVESLKAPITKITVGLIDKIVEQTGIDGRLVEENLQRLYPHGAIGAFMTQYFDMATKGRDEATEFEKATVTIFNEVFGFNSKHVGPIGLTPDVLLLSDSDKYSAIIDNKAYSRYSISNDHHNRMIHNYIEGFKNYCDSPYPLAFFSYIAGGFGSNIDAQLMKIVNETGVNGSAVTVSSVIQMVEKQQAEPYSHAKIRELFSLNRQLVLSDL